MPATMLLPSPYGTPSARRGGKRTESTAGDGLTARPGRLCVVWRRFVALADDQLPDGVRRAYALLRMRRPTLLVTMRPVATSRNGSVARASTPLSSRSAAQRRLVLE